MCRDSLPNANYRSQLHFQGKCNWYSFRPENCSKGGRICAVTAAWFPPPYSNVIASILRVEPVISRLSPGRPFLSLLDDHLILFRGLPLTEGFLLASSNARLIPRRRPPPRRHHRGTCPATRPRRGSHDGRHQAKGPHSKAVLWHWCRGRLWVWVRVGHRPRRRGAEYVMASEPLCPFSGSGGGRGRVRAAWNRC